MDCPDDLSAKLARLGVKLRYDPPVIQGGARELTPGTGLKVTSWSWVAITGFMFTVKVGGAPLFTVRNTGTVGMTLYFYRCRKPCEDRASAPSIEVTEVLEEQPTLYYNTDGVLAE